MFHHTFHARQKFPTVLKRRIKQSDEGRIHDWEFVQDEPVPAQYVAGKFFKLLIVHDQDLVENTDDEEICRFLIESLNNTRILAGGKKLMAIYIAGLWEYALRMAQNDSPAITRDKVTTFVTYPALFQGDSKLRFERAIEDAKELLNLPGAVFRIGVEHEAAANHVLNSSCGFNVLRHAVCSKYHFTDVPSITFCA